MLIDMKTLEGDLFGPEQLVRIYLFPHTLKSDRLVFDVPAGLSVTEAIRYARGISSEKYLPNKFAFYLQDGTRIPEHMWDNVRLKPNTSIAMRPVAEAPIFAIFAALPALMGSVSAFFAGMGFFGKLLLTGITMGIKFLLSKLFAPKPPDKSDAKPVYSITSSRNQMVQWGAIPLLLGKHRITPPLAASPYTETVGNEQYLRQLFCNGYGPLKLEESTVKIGETLVSSYKEAEIEHRYGYTVNESETTLYPKSVIELPLAIELRKKDPAIDQTSATDATTIALDFMWPQGLCRIDDEGKRKNRSVHLSIKYRKLSSTGVPIGDGAFTDTPGFHMTQKTQKALRRTVTYSLPAGQYEFRVHKDSEDGAGSKHPKLDVTNWTALRSFRTGEPVTFTDAPLSFTALRVRASGRLNQSVDTYNCIATSLVTAFNGTTWVANQPSRNPADLYRWVLQCGANRRPYPNNKIDLLALQQWWAYCESKDWHYDKWVVGATSVFDLLTEIASAGRAMPVFKDGKWSVVWDDLSLPVTQLFTPRNSWNFEEQRDLDPIPHGFRVRFPNEEKGWREDERVVYNDGYNKTNATLLEGFEIPGQTHTHRIWQHTRFHLAQRILRPGTFSLSTSWDALTLIRGDRVRVNYDTFKYGLYSGRVVSVDVEAQTVTIDTNILLSGETNYMFRFRLRDGTFLTRTVDPGYVGEFTIIGLVGTASSAMPVAGDLFSFGYADRDSRVLRVVGIEPMDDLVHRLTLVDDAPEISSVDIGQIPDYNTGITEAIDPYTLPPRNVRVTDGAYADGNGQFWANFLVSWESPAYGRTLSFELQYREEGDDEDTWFSAPSVGPSVTTTDIRQLDEGVYTVRIRCVFENQTYSGWVYAPAHATTELTSAPPDVQNFRISVMGDMTVLRWDEVPGVGITYEVRFADIGSTDPVWNSSIPLATASVNTTQFGTRAGTFFIKARKSSGVMSVNATLIYTAVASLSALNYVTSIQEQPTFAGVHERTAVVDEELRLAPMPSLGGYEYDGYYTFANSINLGENIHSRLSVILDAYGFNPANAMDKWVTLESVNPLDSIDKSSWTVRPEYRATSVNPTLNQWTDWTPLGLTDITAWAIQFRIYLKGEHQMEEGTDIDYSNITPAVQQIFVTIDMADRIEQGEDIVAPAAGITITYPNGKYRVVPAVVVTPQNMVQGDFYVIDQKTTTSFRVRFYTAGNVLKSLKFDWMSKGWGRVN